MSVSGEDKTGQVSEATETASVATSVAPSDMPHTATSTAPSKTDTAASQPDPEVDSDEDEGDEAKRETSPFPELDKLLAAHGGLRDGAPRSGTEEEVWDDTTDAPSEAKKTSSHATAPQSHSEPDSDNEVVEEVDKSDEEDDPLKDPDYALLMSLQVASGSLGIRKNGKSQSSKLNNLSDVVDEMQHRANTAAKSKAGEESFRDN